MTAPQATGQSGSSIDHLLLTRVAVRLTAGSAVPDESWLRDRMDLFERWCAPSVEAQTATDFRWLLFVDAGVPDWVVDRLHAAVRQSHEVVRLTASWQETDLGALVAERSGAPWLLTSRLDSDDALARRYVERVRAAVQGRTADVFVNLLNGAQYVEGRLSTYSHPSNAFLSRLEARAEGSWPRTVMSVSHDVAGREAPVVQLQGDPGWLQVLHGGNLLNGAGGWRVRPERLLPHFALTEELPGLSWSALLVGRVQDAAAIMARIAARPSRLRWIPRYLLARVLGSGRRAGPDQSGA